MQAIYYYARIPCYHYCKLGIYSARHLFIRGSTQDLGWDLGFGWVKGFVELTANSNE